MGKVETYETSEALYLIYPDDDPPTIIKVAMTDDEFHVDTPKKDGGAKKKKKYGWMDSTSSNPFDETVISDPVVFKPASSIDAIFIAPSATEAIHYAEALNYNLNNVLLCGPTNYEYKLNRVWPDEDVPVHICGSWLNDEIPANEAEHLLLVRYFLSSRGFDFIEVNEIGK